MYRQTGSTTGGFLIFITIVAFVILGIPGMMGSCDNGVAPENAARYAERAGWEVIEVGDRDSDNDKYVSVVFRTETGEMVGYQCGTGYGFACVTGVNTCKPDSAKAIGGYRGEGRNR